MRILVVDDEAKLADVLRRGLEEEGHQVEVAHDGDAGLARALASRPDLVVLDLMLPGRDGLSVCQALRAAGSEAFVLMLSARGEAADRVVGLRHGADDYLAKPFAFEELVARIEAAGRRMPRGHTTMVFQDVTLDLVSRGVTRGSQVLSLTNREFDLLAYFMRRPGQVLGREELSREVWGMDFDPGTNVVDVYVTYVRRKLEVAGPRLIHTVRGEGYCLGELGPRAPA